MRSIRSMPSLRLVACAPILATLIIGAGQATAASTPTTGTPANQTAAETTLPIATDVPPTTDDAPADVPDAVTVVSQTPDGGLNVQEIPADDPALTARTLDAEPGVTASTGQVATDPQCSGI